MKVRTNGAKVKQLRAEKGWKQEELVAQARSSTRTIQRIESGEGAGHVFAGFPDAGYRYR